MKYKVKYTVMARRGPGTSWTLGFVWKGTVFDAVDTRYGWVALAYNKWIPAGACEVVVVPPPVHNPNLFTVPLTGKYVQCLHDYQWRPDGRPRTGLQGKPMPETVPMLDKRDFIPLNADWQQFWFNLLVKAAGGTMTSEELITAWASLTADKRAFTDQHAVQNGFYDAIQGINVGNPPISIKTLSCGGNILNVTKRGGASTYFRTLNGSLPPPLVDDIWGDQSVIHWATEATHVKFPNKTFQVGRFPQLKGRGVPFPIISMTGENSTWTDRVIDIRNGQEYSPYNPPSA